MIEGGLCKIVAALRSWCASLGLGGSLTYLLSSRRRSTSLCSFDPSRRCYPALRVVDGGAGVVCSQSELPLRRMPTCFRATRGHSVGANPSRPRLARLRLWRLIQRDSRGFSPEMDPLGVPVRIPPTSYVNEKLIEQIKIVGGTVTRYCIVFVRELHGEHGGGAAAARTRAREKCPKGT